MRTLTFAALVLTLAAALPAAADSAKQLENVHGEVAYRHGTRPQTPIAPSASVTLSDTDYAITGAQSLAAVDLADSSRVLVGAASKIQLAFFNQAQTASAKFLVYEGKIRFEVRHPKGARANYTFQTPTASIAVRGTQGDIETGPGGSVRVNVYEVCDPNLPVLVTTKNGERFSVVPGQSFFAQYVNGRIQAQVEQLSQQLIDEFSPDFGVPSDWNAAKQQIVAAAQQTAAGAIDNAAPSGVAAQIASGVSGLFGKKSAPATPAPAATPTRC